MLAFGEETSVWDSRSHLACHQERQRAAAVQNLTGQISRELNAVASWSAAALCRFSTSAWIAACMSFSKPGD
jgi:hypothetical protein